MKTIVFSILVNFIAPDPRLSGKNCSCQGTKNNTYCSIMQVKTMLGNYDAVVLEKRSYEGKFIPAKGTVKVVCAEGSVLDELR